MTCDGEETIYAFLNYISNYVYNEWNFYNWMLSFENNNNKQ